VNKEQSPFSVCENNRGGFLEDDQFNGDEMIPAPSIGFNMFAQKDSNQTEVFIIYVIHSFQIVTCNFEYRRYSA
jgi:hypothetical protein